ncbi:MAG: SPOR domain-containing protein [Gammaproteobacteria bacterium]|nr:MAG: SPOR domain-containing protein [Gammaproteobacteria bacterium]RLA37785.1 MAG: SPOR domain-containing protein [Gammaproteobacteria bacterium]
MTKRKLKRKPVRKRKTRRSPQKQADYPGWMWMLFGLAIGLSVAFAIFMKDREADVPVRTAAQQPASMASTIEQSVQTVEPAPAAAVPEEPAEQRFDFYEMLPNFEVVIPEQETNVSHDTQKAAVVQPGIYVLQAGSFTDFEDADRRRAQLALQGIESRIQRVTIDDKTYHRVRIGPTNDLDELNRLRNRLKAANIDVLRIRLGD